MLRFDYFSRNPYEAEIYRHHAYNFYNCCSRYKDKSRHDDSKNRKRKFCDDSHKQMLAVKEELEKLKKCIDDWVDKVNFKESLKKLEKLDVKVVKVEPKMTALNDKNTENTVEIEKIEKAIEVNDANLSKREETDVVADEMKVDDAKEEKVEEEIPVEQVSEEERRDKQQSLSDKKDDLLVKERTDKRTLFVNNNYNHLLPSVEVSLLQGIENNLEKFIQQETLQTRLDSSNYKAKIRGRIFLKKGGMMQSKEYRTKWNQHQCPKPDLFTDSGQRRPLEIQCCRHTSGVPLQRT